MKAFLPVTQGDYASAVSPNLLAGLADRVRSGLFPMASAKRNAYEVVTQTSDSLRFRSTGLLSGINVGLNDVTVSMDRSTGGVHYQIKYWTWAKYCVLLCLTLFLLGLFCLTVGRTIFPPAWFVEVDRSPVMAWSMLGFWGLAWPWILIAMHKPNVRKCLVRIMDEVNT